MVDKEDNKEMVRDEGIIVDTSLDVLREGAKKVLFEFNETILDINGKPRASESEIKSGDTVLFVEDIPNVPARIVAVYMIKNFWYVNTTSETPRGGYPSGRDAMKAAEMDFQNLKILERFVIEKEGENQVKDIEGWKPDLRSEAADVLNILRQAVRKWRH
ncbi:MAG: hypothetical protein ACXADC_16155 [Candidatus Thorarchaeota archaeon]|jgi:hypothetical protein